MSQCEGNFALVFIKSLLFFVCFFYSVYWTARFYIKTSNIRHPIHQIASISLWCKTLSDLISLYYCRFPSDYLLLTLQVTYIASTTVSIVAVLLVTLGYGVTKPDLTPSESTHIAVLLACLFTGFSLYIISPLNLSLIILSILGVLFALSMKFLMETMERLEEMGYLFRVRYRTAYLPRIREKYRVYAGIYHLVVVFYAAQLVSLAGLHAAYQLIEPKNVLIYLWIDVLECLVEETCLIWIFSLIRPQSPSHSLLIRWEVSDPWSIPTYIPQTTPSLETVFDLNLPILVRFPDSGSPKARDAALGEAVAST